MSALKGIVAATWIALQTLALGLALMAVAAIRALLRRTRHYAALTEFMDRFIDRWVRNNVLVLLRGLRVTQIDATWRSPLHARDRWHLVIANHQTWSDILVLQSLFLDRVPPLKFFVKRELLWLPMLGFCMWLLDFPFLRRYGAEQLARDPSLAGRDRAATVAACKRFRVHPTSVLIFVEGSRFTRAKRDEQQSPYRRLLTPRAGGIGYVVQGLGDRLDDVVDVTLLYPDGAPTFWDLLCGRCSRVEAVVTRHALPSDWRGAEDGGDTLRAAIKAWLGEVWQQKDNLITQRLATNGAR